MPVFQFNGRTLEGYLAGIGAGGTLVAAGVAVFVLLVGIATFNAWPRGSHVLPGSEAVGVDGVPVAVEAATPRVPNLVRLLGRPLQPSSAAPRRERGGAGSPRNHGVGGGTVVTPVTPTRPQATPGGTPKPPSAGSETGSRDLLSQTISGVGNAVEGDTTALGDDLGGSDSLVGGVVQGVGRTVNGTLQGLAGSP
jgi:hypothetical protein